MSEETEKVIDFNIESDTEPWEAVYYETSDSGGRYWERYKDRYLSRSERQVARMLKKAGYKPSLSPDELKAGETLSEVDECVRKIETEQVVDMAGAFAGWHAGFHRISGRPVLVTESPQLVKPIEPGDACSALDEELPIGGKCHGWPHLGKYYNSRFGTDRVDSADQMATWCAVLRRQYLAMQAGVPQRCQALVFAGDPGSGKSLNFSIMTHIFGGKAYKPLRYLMGRTEFNKGMVYSPLLLVDDEGSDTKISSRKMLTANVKQIVATETLSCHGKGQDEFDIRTQRMICFAVNMEEDNLMVLPPMDPDVEGKIHLFRFYSDEWPWPASWMEEQIWNLVSQEIPHFLHWLLNEFKLDDRLYEQRFGVQPFHHIEVLEGLDFLSPESRLLGWIERTVLKDRDEWTGTALQLEEELKGPDSPLTFDEKDKVPAANPQLGKQLTKLSNKPQHAGRFQQVRTREQRLWKIVSQNQANAESGTQTEQEEVEL